MLKLTDMTQIQQNRISENVEEDLFSIERTLDQLDLIEQKVRKEQMKIGQIRERICSKDYDVLYDALCEMTAAFGRLSVDTGNLIKMLGYRESKDDGRAEMTVKKHGRFVYHEIFFEVYIDELLPHKPHYDVSAKRIKYSYDVSLWKASYRELFNKELRKEPEIFEADKISICYVLHVPDTDESGIADADNYDTKPMTDIISDFVLKSDDARCCNYLVDVVFDEGIESMADAFTHIVVCKAGEREAVLRALGY